MSSSSRSLQACLPCQKSKVRCSGNTPCDRCHRAGVECVYVAPKTSIPPNDSQTNVITEINGDDRVAILQAELLALRENHSRILRRHEAMLEMITQKIGLEVISPNSEDPVLSYPHDDRQRLAKRRRSHTPPQISARNPSPPNAPEALELPHPYLSEDQLVSWSEEMGLTPRKAVKSNIEPGLIEVGIVTEHQARTYFDLYKQHLSRRNPLLQPITSLPDTPTLLRDVVITLGVRSEKPKLSDLHRQCAHFTRGRLVMAGRVDLDDIHAAIIFGAWHGDMRTIRMAVGWAYEVGLHRSTQGLQKLVKELSIGADLRHTDVEERATQLINRFRLWMSCCNAELHMCLYAGIPTISRGIEQSIDEALHWFSLVKSPLPFAPPGWVLASLVTEFDIRIVTYSQMVCILLRFREALPPSVDGEYNDASGQETVLLSLIEEYDAEMTNWATMWHAAETRSSDRLSVPLAFARSYIHSFALRGVKPDTVVSDVRSKCIATATRWALEAIRRSLEMKVYQITLNSSMEFMLRHAFGFSVGFLFASMMFAPAISLSPEMPKVLKPLATLLRNMSESGSIGDEIAGLRSSVERLLSNVEERLSADTSNIESLQFPTIVGHDVSSQEIFPELSTDGYMQSLFANLTNDQMWSQSTGDDFGFQDWGLR